MRACLLKLDVRLVGEELLEELDKDTQLDLVLLSLLLSCSALLPSRHS